ncbi:MAG: ATP-binding cassette subfamily F protein 3 [Planctomycetota bacterium]|jgi:ATP-binding cassette subfamily F protein 3
MSLLILEDLKKHFGAQEVLTGASLTIVPGAKIGIVGRNGGGKSTLFKMITREEAPDWGKITMRRGARLGTVPQHPKFDAGVTVRSYVEGGLDDARKVMAELEAVGESMGSADGVELERIMRRHDELSEQLESLGGWDLERTVETVLSGIGLGSEFWEREACTLSGGEKNRVALSRELVGGHDLLLLDEPTNHLDLHGIEWIENYMRELPGAVLVVSHDRRLLNNSVSQILELEQGSLTSYPGNYNKYVQLKAERFENDSRAWRQQQDMLRKEDLFIKKHMGSQRTAEAKGRAKKLTHVVRLEQPFHDIRRPNIKAPETARGGEKVLEGENLSGGYEGNVLFEGVTVRISRGQRIGIVGPNGAGKSTLMKILVGRLEPLKGQVLRGHGEEVAYYDQNTSHLRDDHTPWKEIYRYYPKMTDQEIRSHLALFLFRGKDVDKDVSALSGGERARLALAIMVLENPSWIAMDEPTNHLDLASRTALEEMLSEFQGALVCISHDREFLDGLTNYTIEVSHEGVTEFDGNYSAWRAAQDEARIKATEVRSRKAVEDKRKATEAAAKAAKSNGKQDKSGKKPRNPYKFAKLEELIIKLEGSKEALESELTKEEVYSNSERLRDTQFQLAELEMELEQANEDWANWG